MPSFATTELYQSATTLGLVIDIGQHMHYSIRHSFAAWSLLGRIDPIRLVKLMGHGSKKMVYDVYGNYMEGLEDDFYDIVNYFGRECFESKRRPLLHYNILSESLGESRGPEIYNQLILLNNGGEVGIRMLP